MEEEFKQAKNIIPVSAKSIKQEAAMSYDLPKSPITAHQSHKHLLSPSPTSLRQTQKITKQITPRFASNPIN
jgi:hypothetical protein